MALTLSACRSEAVLPWPLPKQVCQHSNSALAAVLTAIMSVDSSSSVSLSKDTPAKKWQQQKDLSSGQSTESEGPFIVVDGMSSNSDDEATESFPNDDVSQNFRLMSLSEQDSFPSSGADITSESGDSEAGKRSVTPSTSLVLRKFLEDALSDDGLSHDLFLLKHVRRHRHGFVSLKLLAGYKQAKKMACDWQSLSLAARQSSFLEVNIDGRKVRRKTPLPDALLHVPPSRVLAAINIPEDMMTIETLASTFGKFGNVSSLHLVKHKPGGSIPEALLSLTPSVPEVSYSHCALVQYEDVWGVARALKEFSSPQTSVHAVQERRKTSRSSASSRRSSFVTVTPHYPSPSPNATPSIKRKSYVTNDWRRRMAYEVQPDSTGSESEELELRRRRMELDGRKSRASCPNIYLVNRSLPITNSLPSSPNVVRKKKDSRVLRDPRIIRDPRGPDGTRGFKYTENDRNIDQF